MSYYTTPEALAAALEVVSGQERAVWIGIGSLVPRVGTTLIPCRLDPGVLMTQDQRSGWRDAHVDATAETVALISDISAANEPLSIADMIAHLRASGAATLVIAQGRWKAAPVDFIDIGPAGVVLFGTTRTFA